MTGLDLVTRAMKVLAAIASDETPTNTEAVDGLAVANDWIDAQANEGFTTYFLLRTLKTLTAGTASYTIGTGGAINIVRPVEIDHAALILDTSVTPPNELGIDVFTDQQWEGIVQKTYSATYPTGIYYDFNWTAGLATVSPWPIPNQSLSQLVLYTPQALTAMALAVNVTFPPGYQRLLIYGTAREMSAEFGGWDEHKERIYLDAKRTVQGRNLRMTDLQMPGAYAGRARSNIYTGEI